MTGSVIYVDRFTVRDGELENFRRYAEEMAELVQATERGRFRTTTSWTS